MARALVTGGSGFIGCHLVDLLVSEGHEVANLDRAKPIDPTHGHLHRSVDLLDRTETVSAIRSFRPTWIFHLAARTDCDEKTTVSEGYADNTVGSANVLEGARLVHGLECILVTSSQYVCRPGYVPKGDDDYCPHTVYGHSKVQTERLARAADLTPPVIIVRPTNIWGPWHFRYRKQVWSAIQRGLYLHPGGEPVIRSYGYVQNVVAQMLALVKRGHELGGRTLYVGDPPRDLYDWVNGFSIALKARPARRVPRPVLRAIGSAGDVLGRLTGREMPLQSSRYHSMVTSDPAPMQATYDLLGPPPVSLWAAIDETVKWLRSYDGKDGIVF